MSADLKLENKSMLQPSMEDMKKKEKDKKAGKRSLKCSDCGAVYNLTNSYFKHKYRGCFNRTRNASTCLVPGCTRQFYHVNKMIDHLSKEHDVDVSLKSLTFNTFEEFMEWMHAEEAATMSSFYKRSVRKLETVTYITYVCQKDGTQKKVLPNKTSRRRSLPSVKLETLCPARILVVMSHGQVSVRYCSHHNHPVLQSDIQQHPVKQEVRDEIRRLMEVGISCRKVLARFHSGKSKDDQVGENMEPKREDFLTAKYIRSLFRTELVKYRLDEHDATSVSLHVAEMFQQSYLPAFVYKPAHQAVIIGDEDTECLVGLDDAFILGIQTENQRNMMMMQSHTFLYVDIIPYSSENNFLLINFIVPDEFGKGYPVVHIICNSDNENLYFYAVKSLQSKNPDLNVNYVMTDSNQYVFKVFRTLFGGQVKHILSQWHLMRILRQHYPEQPEIQQQLHCSLQELMQESYQPKFQELLDAFAHKYISLAPNFVVYFINTYSKRPQAWAACYRHVEHGRVNSNTLVELFHSRLKSYFMQTKQPVKRIDELLCLLLKLSEECFQRNLEMHRKFQSLEVPLFDKHTNGMGIPDSYISQLSSKKWQVRSPQDPSQMCVVEKKLDTCVFENCGTGCEYFECADLCVHLYSCNCDDFETDMCKHVHRIHNRGNIQVVVASEVVSDDVMADVVIHTEALPGDETAVIPIVKGEITEITAEDIDDENNSEEALNRTITETVCKLNELGNALWSTPLTVPMAKRVLQATKDLLAEVNSFSEVTLYPEVAEVLIETLET